MSFVRRFNKPRGTHLTTTMKAKSASQTARELARKNPILLTIAILALWASPDIALADDGCTSQTNWGDSITGNWFSQLNWDSGVPHLNTGAHVNNGTATIGGPGAEACNLILGETGRGTVSIDNGDLDVRFELIVGSYGKSVLNITNGGSVAAELLTIAIQENSNGTMSVDGGTVAVDTRLDIGGDAGSPGGIALLSVTSGGTVSAANAHVYKSGTLTGNGAVTMTSPLTPVVTIDGTLAPTGTLTIGGNLTFVSGGTMQCNVTPSSWDRVEVSGTATLNGRLSVKMTGTFTPPANFPLLHASTLIDSFASVSITYPTDCLVASIVYDRVNGYVNLHVESTCQ